MMCESSNFIYPLFIHESDAKSIKSNRIGSKEAIPSMPGIFRHDLDSMMQEIQESVE